MAYANEYSQPRTRRRITGEAQIASEPEQQEGAQFEPQQAAPGAQFGPQQAAPGAQFGGAPGGFLAQGTPGIVSQPQQPEMQAAPGTTFGGQRPGGFDYEAARNSWMSKGRFGSPQEAMAAADQWAQQVGATKLGDDVYQLPNGARLDIIGNLKSGRNLTANWTDETGGGGGGGAPGGGFGGGPIGGRPGGPQPAMQAPGGPPSYSPYTPGQLPTAGLQAYTPGQLPQFQAPNQGAANQLQQQALMSALQSGGSLNPQAVAQMKGVQQGQAAQMQQAQAGRLAQSAAQRGVGGGVLDAQQRRSEDAMQAALLGGYRDIDINAARTNFGDVLAAGGALGEALSGEAGRASSLYQTGLGGRLAQEQLQQAGVGSQNEATRFALQRALAQEGLQAQAAGMGEQSRQFGLGLGEQGREFDIGQQLARAQLAQQGSQFGQSLGEQMRQYNMGYGLSAAQMQQQREQDYLRTLLGGR